MNDKLRQVISEIVAQKVETPFTIFKIENFITQRYFQGHEALIIKYPGNYVITYSNSKVTEKHQEWKINESIYNKKGFFGKLFSNLEREPETLAKVDVTAEDIFAYLIDKIK